MGIVATLGLIYAGFTALTVAAAVSVVRKAGYCGWWVLGGLVPLANIVLFFAFSFADWPVLRELQAARNSAARAQQGALSTGHPAFGYPPNPVARRP